MGSPKVGIGGHFNVFHKEVEMPKHLCIVTGFIMGAGNRAEWNLNEIRLQTLLAVR